MKFVYKHLKVKAETPEKAAELLSAHTQEVESVTRTGVMATGVVSGAVIDVQPHPNADRLRVATIDIGNRMIDIVTGAPNIATGQIVPVALLGARVIAVDHRAENVEIDPTQFMTIEETDLRGITSPGMVCGADELGLSSIASKEMYVFPPDTPIGRPVEEIIASEAIIETDDKGTAHRPDLLSYRGIEQELAAILDQPYAQTTPTLAPPMITPALTVAVENARACPLFLVAKIEGLKATHSPDWLVEFLTDHNIKVINLPTDVTNYLMIREGYPTHCFDADAIVGHTVTVRAATKNEEVLALNHQTYVLSSTDLVIADARKALDVAGVIGGEDSATKEGSDAVVLTCGVFNPAFIRQTSKRLGLRTEASARFERGLSIPSAINVFAAACKMISELGGGEVTYRNYIGHTEYHPHVVQADPEAINQLLGTGISKEGIISLLNRLNYQVQETGLELAVSVPWWRSDADELADVAEDIARLYGYNQIESTVPHITETVTPDSLHILIRRLRHFAAASLYEVQTSSMVTHGDAHSVEIQNPIGPKRFVRQTILPELFTLTEHLMRESYNQFGCFEIGRTYRKDMGRIIEKHRFAAVIDGDAEKAKSIIGTILHRAHIPVTTIRFQHCPQTEDRAIKYDAVSKMFIGETLIGHMCLKRYRKHTLSGFKLYLEELVQLADFNPQFHPYSKYPLVKRDVAFVVDQVFPLGTIVALIREQSPLLQSVTLFDRFSDSKMGKTEQSLAFHLTFQSDERTLRDDEVNEIMSEIEKQLQQQFKTKMRE